MSDETRPSEVPPQSRQSINDDTLPASTPPEDNTPRATPPPRERYRLGVEIGRGGMGRVVEAFDMQLLRTVALKEVLPQTGASIARRFAREVHITARLEHASIVPLYDSGTMPDGRPYYVMRKVAGQPLDEKISRARGIGERLTLLPRVLAAIDAIAHAHKRNIIHRDLKPANILLGEHGETVVIDWGLAKVVGETEERNSDPGDEPSPADSLKTQVGSVFGTPGFMSPEQARGDDLGPRSDVFALGATLYQLLAGSPPLVGKSATEVIEATHTRRIIPIAQVAPGAPPELVAIVDKALAFEPAARYADAASLGEDVRRFLDGQLVAAHRYTRRERLKRFVRRHRLVLSIAALAVIVIAIIGGWSLRRIIAARDALASERERLIVENARTAIRDNPAYAAALLKTLPASSQWSDQARGVAISAVLHGVPYAIRAPLDHAILPVADPDMRWLAVLAYSGEVRIYDLEAHRLALTVDTKHERQGRMCWVGSSLMIYYTKSPPTLLDPTTGRITLLDLPNIVDCKVDDSGRQVILLDDHKRVLSYDVALRTATPLDVPPAWHVAVAPDGEWTGVVTDTEVIVLDRGGARVESRVGAAQFIEFSDAHQLAVEESSSAIYEITLDAPKPAWRLIRDPAHEASPRLDFIYYHGRTLVIGTPGGRELWDGDRMIHVVSERGVASNFVPALHDVILYAESESKIQYDMLMGSGTITLPAPVPEVKLVAHRNQSRLAVVGTGVILIYDLGAFVPEVLTKRGVDSARWIDDHTVLVWPDDTAQWSWLDVRTWKRTPAENLASVVPTSVIADSSVGRILLRDIRPDMSRLIVISRDGIDGSGRGEDVIGCLAGGDTILYSLGDGQVSVVPPHGEPRALVKLDGRVAELSAVGETGFAAMTRGGQLVRGNLVTGVSDRVHIDPPRDAPPQLAGAANGNVYIGVNGIVFEWSSKLHELARFDTPIRDLEVAASGLIVVMQDGEARLLELGGDHTVHRILQPSAMLPAIAPGGSYVAGVYTDQGRVVELPSNAEWTFTSPFLTPLSVQTAPDGKRILMVAGGVLAMWTRPQADADLKRWLDRLTNAELDRDGKLAWPWQQISSQPPAP